MKAQIGRCVLAFAAFAAIAGSQTESYDVRHVRWGMSMAEVRAAEPEKFNTPDNVLHVLSEIDTVVGIDNTFIIFDFGPKGLEEVTFLLYNGTTSDNADDWLFAWWGSLSKKYGPGYLFSGDSKIGEATTLDKMEVARRLYHRSNIEFHIQFTDNNRTVVNLGMHIIKGKGSPTYHVSTHFFPFPKDNF